MALVSEAALGSLVLGSADPERLAAWYQSVFAPDEQMPDLVLRLARGLLIFEARDDVAEGAAEPGRIIINIEVDDMDILASHVENVQGLEWIRPVETIPVGRIATLKDADGNFVNVIQLNG
jgi:predicted enzyme related to lactoylglutathione lyase